LVSHAPCVCLVFGLTFCLILWTRNFPSSNEVGRIGRRPGESTILRLLNWFLDTGFGVVRFAYISVNRSGTVWCIRSLSQLFTYWWRHFAAFCFLKTMKS
jgi:hypothetical protein